MSFSNLKTVFDFNRVVLLIKLINVWMPIKSFFGKISYLLKRKDPKTYHLDQLSEGFGHEIFLTLSVSGLVNYIGVSTKQRDTIQLAMFYFQHACNFQFTNLNLELAKRILSFRSCETYGDLLDWMEYFTPNIRAKLWHKGMTHEQLQKWEEGQISNSVNFVDYLVSQNLISEEDKQALMRIA